MQTILICGSRNPNGQTALAADAVRKGLAKAGASAEQVFLPTLKVERCRQCDDNGWGLCRKEGRCVIDDDLSGLVEKIRQADAIVFATPVYYSDLSESLRAFADRLRRICTHAAGRVSIKGKPAIGVCVAGGGGGGAPACCVSLEKVMTTCGLDVVDMIPVRRQNLQTKLQILELAGQWLAAEPRSG
ncbi:MAG: flavodoxin family protein [Lentisphaerae bacterium]|nr:flavodoxin family protein [Lentisphaerota bacterium]